MRFFDLVLAIIVLAVLILIAREQFPSYEGKAITPPSPSAMSPTPWMTPAP